MSYLINFILLSSALTAVIITLAYVANNSWFNGDYEKRSAYECGFEPFGDARSFFDIHFYIVGLLFIIFDLEVVFLVPLVSVSGLSLLAYANFVVFMLILVAGLYYEWSLGLLSWASSKRNLVDLSPTRNSTGSTNQEQGGLLSITRSFLLPVALLFAAGGEDSDESETVLAIGRIAGYEHGDSLTIIRAYKKDYDNNVETLRKLITERILLGDSKYACAEWTWDDVIHGGVKVLGLREGTIGPKPEKDGPHAHYVGRCVHAKFRSGPDVAVGDKEGGAWYLIIAEVVESDLADSRVIYAYNPAMAVVMLLPEKRFVCVPCVAALRIPFELKNSSGEITKPRVGVLFRSEVVSLLAGSFLKLDGSDSDFDRAVVEVIIWLGPIHPGHKPL